MQRWSVISFVVAVAVMIGMMSTVTAGMHGDKEHMEGDKKGKSSMMHKKMMKKHMSGKAMPGMMMGGMNQKKVIPTQDGGVVVMLGNKLYKYNKKMKKIGEATSEIDEEDMEKMMQNMRKMRKKCMKMWDESEEE